ncbi:uncharacterized protein PV09_05054 [Verruconis gallopava]|uniref:Heme haloperoxidase family profile domain-containing protein n=1 Tax=Verruconis gallopava TaxID=253628 RepID=A0A0D1YSX8_9PEZI|nr:uncharacterized protein PV09_05054 [Verruconis gallopava]KIW03747.1 hypothetical protein PV09_05054 [Verruconis gallopava]
MHLSPVNIIKACLSSPFSSRTRLPVDSKVNEDHSYVKGDPANRGPCPGLNALCNQGYFIFLRPRDGKNISVAEVEHALMTALHMSKAAAKSLTSSLPPLLRKDGKFDLVDTRRHDIIEHDASFTRLDFRQGDNYTFQPHMLEAMIQDAEGGDVTLRTLAKTFIRRHQESRAAGAP